MPDLVIYGAGGYGREVCQVVEDLNDDGASWNVLGFLDGDSSRHGTALREMEILGDASWLGDRPAVAVAVAVGSPAARRRVVAEIAATGPREHPVLVHPLAWTGRNVSVGAGSVLLAGVTASTDIEIGEHACINKNAIVGHDAVIGPFATVAPGASISGYARIGEGADIGANSVVVQHHEVGAWSVVGAGAVVTRDLPPDVTAVGAPAKVIKRRERGWHEA